MIMFLLCQAQKPRIMNYLRPFATTHKWNRISEIGILYFVIFTYLIIVTSPFKNTGSPVSQIASIIYTYTSGLGVSFWYNPFQP